MHANIRGDLEDVCNFETSFRKYSRSEEKINVFILFFSH